MSALIASLFAVGAAPAAALDEDSKPNKPAATSACVGDAAEDMDFSDVSEMHTFRADINCLAYYGVTIGYGDGTFGPGNDVTRGQMVLFMERAAAISGADAEAVVGDFAETGSDPVHRGDMALLIARLLVSATSDESPVNVKNNDDGTFAVDGVADKDWDYFADARRSLNRVDDSAVSALYELGVAKGTGMGYFSPASSVNRGQMAAFITRALAHTTARPAGVSVQSDGPGEVIISVRDANFRPVANAAVDVFSVSDTRIDEAFNEDGSCNTPRLTGEGGNAMVCQIDALDEPTGLSGDIDPGSIDNVQPGGRTVFAWTGESGDKVEDGGEGLASIGLTETAPVTATDTKVTNDLGMGVTRAHFGSTVTVTIQLVGDATANRADAGPPTGGASYTVTTRRASQTDIRGDVAPTAVDDAGASSKTTQVLKVDASGKATFTITASDPDATDRNNPVGADASGDEPAVPNKIDRVNVTYEVALGTGALQFATDIDGSSATGTITFSDERGVFTAASLKTTADYLMAPSSGGSASNVVTVTVVDQFGKPVRGHLVQLSSNHSTNPPAEADTSTFPVARRTDSSGTVRIGYSHRGTGSVEALVANTSLTNADDTITLTPITGGTASFYWASPAAAGEVTAADIRVADVDRNTVVIGGDATTAPSVLVYDDNDQFVIGTANSTMAAFEEALAKEDTGTADTVGATQYNPTDSTVVARFTLTVNA